MISCTEFPNYQYCDMYHIAECFAFYTFIYDASQTCLISFPEPSYAKTTTKKKDCYFLRKDKMILRFFLYSVHFICLF